MVGGSARATMNAVCELCGAIGYEQLLLCCSDCKGAQKNEYCFLEKWCRYCLEEVLYKAPEEWFCDECNQRRNEGSYSGSLGNGSTERPSKHAQFDSITQQPITSGINFAVPASPESLATGITQDLGPTERKALAPIRCQDFHSVCSLEAETEVLTVCRPSHVQSKFLVSDGGRRRAWQEQGKRLREGQDRVWQCADSHRDTRSSVGLSEMNKELTFEQVSRHFSLPIKQAAREMNVGVTVLKKQCRKLGITRWPHRKVRSLEKLIDNVQGLGKETAQENLHLSRSLVGFMQQTMKLSEERPTEEVRQVCLNENDAQEDGHLTRSVVEFLQLKKKMIEERPDMVLDQRTKDLRQVCFKESFKRKHS